MKQRMNNMTTTNFQRNKFVISESDKHRLKLIHQLNRTANIGSRA